MIFYLPRNLFSILRFSTKILSWKACPQGSAYVDCVMAPLLIHFFVPFSLFNASVLLTNPLDSSHRIKKQLFI